MAPECIPSHSGCLTCGACGAGARCDFSPVGVEWWNHGMLPKSGHRSFSITNGWPIVVFGWNYQCWGVRVGSRAPCAIENIGVTPVYCRETGVLRSFVIVVHCLHLVSYLNIALGVKRCRPETTNNSLIGPPSFDFLPLPVGRCPSPCRSPSISRITFWRGCRNR